MAVNFEQFVRSLSGVYEQLTRLPSSLSLLATDDDFIMFRNSCFSDLLLVELYYIDVILLTYSCYCYRMRDHILRVRIGNSLGD